MCSSRAAIPNISPRTPWRRRLSVSVFTARARPRDSSSLSSSLINPGVFITNSVIPVTNPFIPADLATLLASRTGNDPNLVGSGATEPFRFAYPHPVGRPARNDFRYQVLQGLIGVRGDISDNWRYEAHASWGRTSIDAAATGNVNVSRLQELLEAPDGGDSLCAGGYNPFGIQPVSQECVDFINETGFTNTTFHQRILQGYVQGDIVELPAGTLSIIAGAEHRKFDFVFDPGALFGPIAGFNTATPAAGGNEFLDFFGEALIPIVKDAPWARNLELSLGIRHSTAQSTGSIRAARSRMCSPATRAATLPTRPS